MMIYAVEVSFSARLPFYDFEVWKTVRRAFTDEEKAYEWGMNLELRRTEAWEMFREEYGEDAPEWPNDLMWEETKQCGMELED